MAPLRHGERRTPLTEVQVDGSISSQRTSKQSGSKSPLRPPLQPSRRRRQRRQPPRHPQLVSQCDLKRPLLLLLLLLRFNPPSSRHRLPTMKRLVAVAPARYVTTMLLPLLLLLL